ncbi:MAG: hypothetical protein ACFFCI_00910 [Promethearchaeota archaeon]
MKGSEQTLNLLSDLYPKEESYQEMLDRLASKIPKDAQDLGTFARISPKLFEPKEEEQTNDPITL